MLLLQVELLLQVATNWSFAMNFWWISSMDISSKPTLVVNPRITFAWRRKGNQNIETSNLPPSPCQRPWAAGTWTSSGSCCSGSYLPQLTYLLFITCSPGPYLPRRSTLRTSVSPFLLVTSTTKRFPQNWCFPKSFTSAAFPLPQIMSKWPAAPCQQSD